MTATAGRTAPALTAEVTDPKPPTQPAGLTYAVQMIIGMPAATAGTYVVAVRGAARCD